MNVRSIISKTPGVYKTYLYPNISNLFIVDAKFSCFQKALLQQRIKKPYCPNFIKILLSTSIKYIYTLLIRYLKNKQTRFTLENFNNFFEKELKLGRKMFWNFDVYKFYKITVKYYKNKNFYIYVYIIKMSMHIPITIYKP